MIWPLALLAALTIAAFLGPSDGGGPLRLGTPDRTRVDQMRAVIDALPASATVLVGMDPDLGTYAEIRPAVRAVMADLLSHGARLAVISFSPEGRAVAVGELDRLRRAQVSDASLLDLGFVAGSEAGLVRSVTHVLPPSASGTIADQVSVAGGGIGAFNLVMLVGGGDIGPRIWVEQVGSRVPDLPMVAIAPTFAQPESQPYLRTGQLRALLATVRDDAAYTDLLASEGGGTAGNAATSDAPPSALAMLLGMLVALGVLAQSSAAGVVGAIRSELAARVR
jgi:hypothetical protein